MDICVAGPVPGLSCQACSTSLCKSMCLSVYNTSTYMLAAKFRRLAQDRNASGLSSMHVHCCLFFFNNPHGPQTAMFTNQNDDCFCSGCCLLGLTGFDSHGWGDSDGGAFPFSFYCFYSLSRIYSTSFWWWVIGHNRDIYDLDLWCSVELSCEC